jgi:hypothetical protein
VFRYMLFHWLTCFLTCQCKIVVSYRNNTDFRASLVETKSARSGGSDTVEHLGMERK